MTASIKTIRNLAPHYIGSAGNPLTNAETQQFIAGTFTPSDEQLAVLARLMKLPEPTK